MQLKLLTPDDFELHLLTGMRRLTAAALHASPANAHPTVAPVAGEPPARHDQPAGTGAAEPEQRHRRRIGPDIAFRNVVARVCGHPDALRPVGATGIGTFPAAGCDQPCSAPWTGW